MDEKRSLFCTLPAAHSGPCQPEKPADPDDVRTESVARLRAEVESLRAENDALNHEIMGYQVDDGYQRGYDHAQAALTAEILRTRAERDAALREAARYEPEFWFCNGMLVTYEGPSDFETDWRPLYRRVTEGQEDQHGG